MDSHLTHHVQCAPREYLYAIERSIGIMHIGGHLAEESGFYRTINRKVLWVEANPDLYEELKLIIQPCAGQIAINALITDKENQEYTFHISNLLRGASSSIYEFGEYHTGEKSLWKDVHMQLWGTDFKMVQSIILQSKTIEMLYRENSIDNKEYDFLVLDIEGAELLALKGAGERLANFKHIWLEVSTVEFHKNGVLWPEIHLFLTQFGFTQATPLTSLRMDVLYKRC
jgi:FkbM family methyltransferase